MFDDGVRKIVAVDLDGTLANIDHRLHLVKKENPDWDAFHLACVNDTPNEPVLKIVEELAPSFGIRLVILTARSKVAEAETRDWLNQHVEAFGKGDVELVMLREAGDRTEDTELKMRWLKEVGGPAAVFFAIEDRQRVVDAWRDAGVTCLHAYAWKEHFKHVGKG